MRTNAHNTSYYLVCAAGCFALASIEWNSEPTALTVFASVFYIIATLVCVYQAYLAILFGSDDGDSGW